MDRYLTDNHRRVIGSGMQIIDAAAVRMLNLLEGRNSSAAINVVEGSVTETERERITASLKQLQAMIASFARKYDLQPSKRSLRRILASDISQIWIALEDSRPGRIRGYGALSPASAASLEADLHEMLLLANTLRAFLNS
jgi:hypothetical protein